MAGRKVRDAREAVMCLSEAASSGLPRARWAHANGVDARSLNAWRLNLKHGEGPGQARMVEVVAREEVAAGRYVVWIGDVGIEVDEGFNDEVLRRLVEVVASC